MKVTIKVSYNLKRAHFKDWQSNLIKPQDKWHFEEPIKKVVSLKNLLTEIRIYLDLHT